MNASSAITMNYEQLTMNYANKNKANTKPIKANTNPIQTQNKANSRKARMDVTLAITRNYNNEQRTMNNERLCKTNPIKPNFKLFAGDVMRRKLLFLTVYNGKCQFNYVERFQKHPDNQAKLAG